MAFESLLIHTVEVYRRSGEEDAFGQPVDFNPSQVTGDPVHTFPCRLNRKTGGVAMEERSRDVFLTQNVIFTMPGIDIREDDAVRVLDETGAELLPMSKIDSKDFATDLSTTHHWEIKIITMTGPH